MNIDWQLQLYMQHTLAHNFTVVVFLFPSGSGDQTVLGYQCDPHMIVVHSSCDPPLVVCCDVISGRHTVWSIRPVTDQV